MNEEEKKAIERIEDTFYTDLGKGINKFQKITLYEDSIRDIRILLNLIEKLRKENEELKESNKKLYEIGQEMCKQDKYTSENYIPVQKIKDIFDVKMHNFNYLSETDWSETQKYKDKEIANILELILQELLEGRE